MLAPILMALVTLGCIGYGTSKDVKPHFTAKPAVVHTLKNTDARCFDADGKFDSDLGADDLDCGNL